MRIIEPVELSRWERRRRRTHSHRRWRGLLLLGVGLVLIGTAGYYRYQRPLPDPTFTPTKLVHASSVPKITWPNYGQAAIGTIEDGVLADNNADKPVPIASVAKVVTALVVLDAKPLHLNQPGPVITLTAADEAIYHRYIAKGGSVSGVTAGKTLTEYQALQAVMLPSSNNISESVTNWAFGSQQKYIEAANKYLKKQGLSNTVVADSSGFSPQTVSTASDVVRLGVLAMNNPVLAQIAAQKEATAEVSGPITNVNRLLGVNGTVGIKTGNTDEAGGCFLLAAQKTLTNGQIKTVIVAVLAAPSLGRAMTDSQPLASQVAAGFRSYTAVRAGQQLGVIAMAWGARSAVVAKEDIVIFGWGNESNKLTAIPALSRFSKGDQVGTATITAGQQTGTTGMVLSDQLASPSTNWRLRRIFSR